VETGARLGPYEIVAAIGAGGMGEVYRARDTRLGRDVAIKVLPGEFASDPERLRRFEREAKATASLSHPNILDVHDVGTFEGVPYLVEELLEGESLKERLERGGLPVPEAVRIACEVAKGLAAAHGKGIVHRDLKPGNVFLTSDGRVKVLDFGLAKLVGTVPLGEAETLTKAPSATTDFGSVMGTVAYMAPEQARGQPVDRRTDVFAFGVVLYEMLSGERPFVGATGTDVVAAILKEEAPPLPVSVSPELSAVVVRCLAKDPAERFQHGGELLAGLEAVQAEGPVPLWPAITRSLGRHPWLVAANAVVAVLILALLLDLGGVRGRLPGRSSTRVIRMAVLPFANLSGDPEQEYLSDGLTQEMIAQLGRLHPGSLSVIARTSVMRYKKSETPIDRIGRELGVEYVLEGSEQREGGRVRITAELVKVNDQTQLWSETYQRELSGILALQSDVARKVAEALALKLLPGEQARLASARAVNPDAYQAYLKGIQHLYRLTPGDFDSAQQYFELALAKDPSYALAYTGIALVWAGRSQLGFVSPAEAAPKAKAAAQKAIGLDDTVAETHFTLAALGAWVDWDWAVAEREFKRAIELNPSFPEALINYSHFLMNMGRPNEAMPQARRALELDPFNPYFHSFFAVDFLYVRQWDEAIAQARTALATAPDNPVAAGVLWYAFGAKGMHKEALAAARVYMKLVYDDRAVDEALERGFAEAGYQEAMRRAAQPLIAHSRKSNVSPMDIASLYVEARETSSAVDWLEKGYEVRDQNMPYIGWPIFDSLHTDPRFQSLLRRINLPTK